MKNKVQLVLVIAILAMVSCQKENQSLKPTIASINPTSGIIGSTLIITGENFDKTPSNNIVKFNGTVAVVTQATVTSLTTTVPTGATTGTITVTVNGQTATSSSVFTILQPPTITNFSPISAQIGATVVINGNNFDPTPANNTVKFNGTAAVVTQATATSLTTTVPTGATTGTITVTVNGQTATSSSAFTYIPTQYTRVIWARGGTATDSLIYAFNTANWYYIAVTKSSANVGSIYINGNLAYQGNTFDNVAYNHSTLNIAAGYYTNWGNYLKASVDEIRVSNVVRSATEINNYWTSNQQFSKDASTFMLWRFDEGSGSTFQNTDNSNMGNLVNNPIWVNGKFGKAVQYDGISQYATSNVSLPTSDVTYEVWVRFDSQVTKYASLLEPYGSYNAHLDLKPSIVK